MKKSRKLKVLTIITILLMSFINIKEYFNNYSTEECKTFNFYNHGNPKKAGFWILTGAPIYIDDTDPNYNWSKIANENAWCSGTGTLNDPYLIENVLIDGLDASNCIEIRNSNKYFIINNCTLYNAATGGVGNDYAAIYLYNASNGKLSNNDCSLNNRYTIYLEQESNNNTITENVLDNNYGGLLMRNCDFNVISLNNISGCTMREGLYLYYSHNNTISYNNVSNNGLANMVAFGIGLHESNENNITNNIANENAYRGISLDNSHRNRIENNEANDNFRPVSATGIYLSSSNYNIILNNSAIDNPDRGILLFHSMSNDIWLNNASKNKNHGIELRESHNNFLWRNTADKNEVSDSDDENGIHLYQSNYNNISQNKVNDNEKNGIYLTESHYNNVSGNYLKDFYSGGINLYLSDNNTLYNNTAYSGNYGFVVDHSHNNVLLRNNATENGGEGISLIGSNYNEILKNILNNNALQHSPGGGMRLIAGSHFNYISENTINENKGFNIEGYGINLAQSHSNTIIKNNMTDNYYYGIRLNYNSVNNTINQNIIKESVRGISIRGLSNPYDYSFDNNITHNTLFNNNYGIYLNQYCYNNTFEANDIISNTQYGVFIKNTCEENDIYMNNFITNSIHAYDNGLKNYWNNSVIGNYWDNYTDVDANDDGIGDIPYTYILGTVGSQDYLPIWEDTDDIAPIITIISPDLNQKFRFDAPLFNVSIIELYLNTSWYTLDGGATNRTFIGLTGQIDQSLWDALPNGTLTITFFINDSAGRIDSDSINIYKDIIGPNITLLSPTLNEILGKKAPRFNISIKDSDLDDLWYMLDNGIISTINITASSLIGSIDQGLWDYFGDGGLTIKFYANDTLGNIGKKFLFITKDIQEPDVAINFPIDDDIFGADAPTFNVRITDDNLELMWYTLDGGLNNYTFTGNGTINPAAWAALLDGLVTIVFYANDTAGNLESAEVNIIKDTQAPIIIVNSPIADDIFGTFAPNFNVRITDDSLNATWYTLDGGLNNYTFTGNGTINPAAWAALLDGPVTITFYANDTFGRLGSAEVNIIKDTQAPIIIVNSPADDDLFGSSAPTFNVRITDGNLDSMWYTLDGGLNNYIFTGNGTINPTAWAALLDGPVTITFYANDTFGHLESAEVNAIKDTQAPTIIINSPEDDDLYGTSAPSFNIRITDDNLDSMWYTLDNGLNNYTFTDNGTINPTAWSVLLDGPVTIIFYANDTFGHLGSAEVYIEKDATGPILIINSPTSGSEFGANAPAFIITITDDHLDSIWYSLDGGVTTHAITTNATIDQTVWSALSEGSITITFYANDTLGHETSEDVIITKSIPSGGDDPTIIIVIVVVTIVGGVAVIAGLYIFMKKRGTPE